MSNKMYELPEKRFEIRENTLTKTLENKYARSFWNFTLAFLAILSVKNAVDDLYYDGASLFGFRPVLLAFKDLHVVLALWPICFLLHALVFVGWHVWALGYSGSKAWNYTWTFLYAAYAFGTFHLVAQYILASKITMICRVALLAEQVRFLMKGYAFVRRKSGELLCESKFSWPKINQFLYFSFAPTLLYRDSYPRTEKILWRKVYEHASAVLVEIYVMALIEEQFVLKRLEHFGKEPFTTVDVVKHWFDMTLPATIFNFVIGPMILLHSWQGMFAEMMRFGDRLFYKEWWLLEDLSLFMTYWNILVQDWLFENVYKDFYQHLVPGKKWIARFAVLLISIAFHEVLLGYCFEITCPVFLTSMISAFSLRFFPKSNLVVLLFTLLGQSYIFTLPHLEFFARKNCPNVSEGIFYVPKLFSCHR